MWKIFSFKWKLIQKSKSKVRVSLAKIFFLHAHVKSPRPSPLRSVLTKIFALVILYSFPFVYSLLLFFFCGPTEMILSWMINWLLSCIFKIDQSSHSKKIPNDLFAFYVVFLSLTNSQGFPFQCEKNLWQCGLLSPNVDTIDDTTFWFLLPDLWAKNFKHNVRYGAWEINYNKIHKRETRLPFMVFEMS